MNREQLKTILWLRWRLLCNQSSRSGGLGAVIAVLVGAGAVLLAGAGFTGALLLGVFGLARVPPPVIMGVWAGVTIGFLFFWMIGLLAELQRSEAIDLQRLMHLPVALGQIFVINYIVSHFTLSIIIFIPVILGLAIGLVIARGLEMVLLIPLALSMVFMITAWTYCLRGWLATLMSNPRRRRTVIMIITLAFVFAGQGPNLYFNVLSRSGRHSYQPTAQNARPEEMFRNLVAMQGFIPPLWVSVGAQGLAEGRVCAGAVWHAGLLRAWRARLAPRVSRHGAFLSRRNRRSGCRTQQAGRRGSPNSHPAGRRPQRVSGTPPPRRAGTGRGAGAGYLPFPVAGSGSENGLGQFVHRDADRRRLAAFPFHTDDV